MNRILQATVKNKKIKSMSMPVFSNISHSTKGSNTQEKLMNINNNNSKNPSFLQHNRLLTVLTKKFLDAL